MFRVILSSCTDPYINLAAEDRMFRYPEDWERVLFLWRNRDAVVMGRYQNPYLECSLSELRKERVLLVRRQSGGGTVFHDTGNTNFTFITPRDEYDKEGNIRIVTAALKETFGIDAYPSGRNDILVEGKKISGSAFKLTSGRAFHHGTLLVDADLKRLSRYLKRVEKQIEAKGIRSVRSEVTNLSRYSSGITHERVCTALAETLSRIRGEETDLVGMDESELLGITGCAEKRDELTSWEWIFGKTPPFAAVFTNTFSSGKAVVRCRVKNGRFEEMSIEAEGVSPDLLRNYGDALIGRTCDPIEIKAAFSPEADEIGCIVDWLASEF